MCFAASSDLDINFVTESRLSEGVPNTVISPAGYQSLGGIRNDGNGAVLLLIRGRVHHSYSNACYFELIQDSVVALSICHLVLSILSVYSARHLLLELSSPS